MCTVLLPPGDNPIAVNKYIIYHNSRDSVRRNILQFLTSTITISMGTFTIQ